MTSPITHLYIIRHGEALTLKDNIIKDFGLTPLGVQQAERLRDRLAGSQEIKADVLIASTFPRARQTAEIVAPALGLPIIFDDDVQEMRPGKAVGITSEEFKEKYGGYDVEKTPLQRIAEGAENWGEFMLRVGMMLERITNEWVGKSIVLICHGGVVDGSLIYHFGMSTLKLPPAFLHTQNTAITYWTKGEHPTNPEEWRLVYYNDAMHLRDLKTKTRIPWASLAPIEEVEGEEDEGPINPASQI